MSALPSASDQPPPPEHNGVSLGDSEHPSIRLVLELSAEQMATLAEQVAAILAAQQPTPWLDTQAAAEHLCTTRAGIHDLTRRGELRAYHRGRKLMFSRADLDALVEPPR